MSVTSGRNDRNCIVSQIQGSINFVLVVINQEKSDIKLTGIKS